MTYSIDKCVKLVGYEYDLPDEVILMIQRMVIDEKFKKSIRDCMCKIHMGVGLLLDMELTTTIPFDEYRELPEFYEDGRSCCVNPVRRCLKTADNWYRSACPNRYIRPFEYCYMSRFMGRDLWGNGNIECGIDLYDILKRDMVEYMKNNGMKFNKSKTKSQLAHIYINHKNFIEEEPFVYTYKNIKKIKYD